MFSDVAGDLKKQVVCVSRRFKTGDSHVIIQGKVFLYKQKAPFIASGKSVYGAIEYDRDQQKIKCHECGGWYRSVGMHANRAHGITERDYKKRHGLRKSSALITEETRAMLIASSRRKKDIAQMRQNLRELQPSGVRASSTIPRPKCHPEARNANGSCQAQLISRIRLVAKKKGGTPTRNELVASGISVQSAIESLNVPTIGALMSLIGLEPNRVGYSPRLLIELLRDFHVKHQRAPSTSDFRRGILPSRSNFYRHFGSLRAALKASGIGNH